MPSKYRIKPVKISIIFNMFTLLLYFYGAYDYPYRNSFLLVFFVAFTNLMMYYGFKYGTREKYETDGTRNNYPRFPIEKLISFLFWISLIMCIPKFIIYTGNYSFDIEQIFQKIISFFKEASVDSYLDRNLKPNATGIWQYINYINVLCGPFMWAYTILGLYFWKKLNWKKKIGSIFIWTINLLSYICTSTNVGFFDFFLTIIIIITIKGWKRNSNLSRQKKKSQIKIILLAVLVFFMLGYIFSFIMLGRSGGNELSYQRPIIVDGKRCNYRTDNIISAILPPAYKPFYAYLTRYLGHPYNALSLSFDVDFIPSLGVGNSWFMMDNLGPLKETAWNSTYNIAIDKAFGYDYYGNWHTAYIWFANDVSHLGVPFLFFILFAYCGKHWRRYWETNDMFSFLTFMLFVKMMIYMSANNQVFQNSDTFIAFWILFIYLHIGKKWRWDSDNNLTI